MKCGKCEGDSARYIYIIYIFISRIQTMLLGVRSPQHKLQTDRRTHVAQKETEPERKSGIKDKEKEKKIERQRDRERRRETEKDGERQREGEIGSISGNSKELELVCIYSAPPTGMHPLYMFVYKNPIVARRIGLTINLSRSKKC